MVVCTYSTSLGVSIRDYGRSCISASISSYGGIEELYSADSSERGEKGLEFDIFTRRERN